MLLVQELLDSTVSDNLKIFGEAHSVAEAIAFVHVFKMAAWVLRALEAVFDLVMSEAAAMRFQKRALLVPWTTAFAVGNLASFSWNLVFVGEVTAA